MTDMTKGATLAHPMSGGADPGRVWKAGDRAMVEIVDVAPCGIIKFPEGGGPYVLVSAANLRPLPAPAPPKSRVWVEIKEPPEGCVVEAYWRVQNRPQRFDAPILAVHRAAPEVVRNDTAPGPLTGATTPEERDASLVGSGDPQQTRAAALQAEIADAVHRAAPLAALRDAVVEAALHRDEAIDKGWGIVERGAALTDAVKALRAAMTPPDPVKELREAWDAPRSNGWNERMARAVAAIAGRDGE